MTAIRDLVVEAAIKQKFGKFKTSLGVKGLSYRVCCPFNHGKKTDKNYKLYITPQTDMYHCFVCGAAGRVQQLLHTTIKQPVILDINTSPRTEVSPAGRLINLCDLPCGHVAIRYLTQRGFDPAYLARNYQIKFCEEGKLFGNIFNTSGTIIIPIIMNGKQVGWQARLLYNPEQLTDELCELLGIKKDEDGEYIIPPKYFTSPGLNKGTILFNYDNARKFEHVVICEGPFDAIKAGLSAVATLGKGVTDQQARLIKEYWKFAIILLDPGDADYEMKKLELDLMQSIECVSINLKGYKDAGEAPTEEKWKQIFEEMNLRNVSLNYLK